MASLNDKSRSTKSADLMKSPLAALMMGILLVAGALAVLFYFDFDERIIELLQWFDEQGFWAPLLFILLMTLVVVLLLPGALFTTGAGFVFGVVEGSIVVILGTTFGAVLAFLAARYLFGRQATRLIFRYARFRLLNDQLSHHSWKVVLLTRLIPFFPSKLANFFFGLTSIRLWAYVAGSVLGFIPFSVHNVYLGSLAADIATLGRQHLHRTPFQWGLYGLGFIATLIAVLYLTRSARRRLADYLHTQAHEEDQ